MEHLKDWVDCWSLASQCLLCSASSMAIWLHSCHSSDQQSLWYSWLTILDSKLQSGCTWDTWLQQSRACSRWSSFRQASTPLPLVLPSLLSNSCSGSLLSPTFSELWVTFTPSSGSRTTSLLFLPLQLIRRLTSRPLTLLPNWTTPLSLFPTSNSTPWSKTEQWTHSFRVLSTLFQPWLCLSNSLWLDNLEDFLSRVANRHLWREL